LDAGGSVRKGEHGIRVYFVSKIEKSNDDSEKPNLVPFLREYVVFNIAQCHGLPDEYLTGEAPAINLDQLLTATASLCLLWRM
jgi:antirestriction protein ArdC